MAYQTDKLKDQAEAKALEGDINLSFIHFCHETNTRFPEEEFSEIIENSESKLNLKNNNIDPLVNIQF